MFGPTEHGYVFAEEEGGARLVVDPEWGKAWIETAVVHFMDGLGHEPSEIRQVAPTLGRSVEPRAHLQNGDRGGARDAKSEPRCNIADDVRAKGKVEATEASTSTPRGERHV